MRHAFFAAQSGVSSTSMPAGGTEHYLYSMAATLLCSASELRGWRVVAIAFILDALALGGRGLFTVTILYFEDLWSWARNESAGLNSCVHVFIAISTIVNGHIADRLSARQTLGFGLVFLALCYALIAAMQTSWQAWLVYGIMTGWAWGGLNLNVFSVAVVNSLPEHRHSFAIGIANTGSTFGMMALVPLFDTIAASHGWRTCYICLAIAVATLAVVAIIELRTPKPHPSAGVADVMVVVAAPSASPESSMIKTTTTTTTVHSMAGIAKAADAATAVDEPTSAPAPSPAAPPSTAAEAAAPTDATLPTLSAKLHTLLTSRAYWLLSLSFIICGITTTGFIETHMVALAVSRGLDASVGALAFSVLSACNGVGMLLAGWLADRVSRTLTLSAIFAVRGGAFVLLLSSAHSQGGLFIFAAIFGIVDYSVVPPVVSLVGSTAGKHTVGLGVGILLAWHSLAAAGGAWMGGEIYQRTGGYDTALVVCAITCFVAALACAAAGPEEALLRRPSAPNHDQFHPNPNPTDDRVHGKRGGVSSLLAGALSRLQEATSNEDAACALETIFAGLASGGGYDELLGAVTSATGKERWFGAWMSLLPLLKAHIVPEGASPVGPNASGELLTFTDTTARLVEAVAFFKEEQRARGEWPKLQYGVMGNTSWPDWYLFLVSKSDGAKG